MKRQSLQIIVFTLIRIALNTVFRMVYPYLPTFARGMGVDLQSIALALSLRSSAGAVSPFLASIAESFGRRQGMLLGLLLYTGGCGLVALHPTYLSFVIALILTLLGNFIYLSSMQAYLGDRVPYQRRGLVLAITEMGWSISFIIGVPLAGWLISRQGWSSPFPVLLVLGLLSIIAIISLTPQEEVRPANQAGKLGNLKAVLTSPAALLGLSGGVAFSLANEVVNLVFGVWMEETFNFQLASLAYLAAVIGLSELGGEALVAMFVDRIGKPQAVKIGLVVNSLAALALAWLGRSQIGAASGLFFFYLSFEFTMVSLIPLMSEILPGARATLLATNVSGIALGRAIGALIALPIFRWGEAGGVLPGILACGFESVLFNGLALGIFSRLKSQISHL